MLQFPLVFFYTTKIQYQYQLVFFLYKVSVAQKHVIML